MLVCQHGTAHSAAAQEHLQGRLVPSHPLNPLYPLVTGGQAVTVAALVGRGSSSAGPSILRVPGYSHVVPAGTVIPNPCAAQAAQQHVGIGINRT